ncbi:MAG: DUF3299 domain-containing protein [Acidiferrobacterales bacterium]|nr:DUF3299 domain-containing protein [Acidiferrobacterales bacterium]
MRKISLRSARTLRYAFYLTLSSVFFFATFAHAEEPKTLKWEELVPEGWNPNSVFDKFTDDEFANMSDEQYFILQQEAQAMLQEAPVVESLNDETVKIPGFLLPLEFDETNIKEFLLVPYFGACVHTPPPPANQIIHGKVDEGFAMNKIFEPVWISGKLQTIRSKQKLGESGVTQTLDVETGYTMEVLEVEPYVAEQ